MSIQVIAAIIAAGAAAVELGRGNRMSSMLCVGFLLVVVAGQSVALWVAGLLTITYASFRLRHRRKAVGE